METSVPELAVEDFVKNADNPFKKKLMWRRIRCRVCKEVVLNKGVSSEREWNKIRQHLKIRHEIDTEEKGIPIRILSPPLFHKWMKNAVKEK